MAALYEEMGRRTDARKCAERAAEVRKSLEEREKKAREAQSSGGKP
jgi:hypothetical protein